MEVDSRDLKESNHYSMACNLINHVRVISLFFFLNKKFADSRSMSTNLEDIHEGEGNRSSFFHNIDMEECMNYEDYEEGFYHPEKKRRLTSTQVESLEKSFDTGNKLEPDRKIQLAKDLGLQPRQVAIWFQNRRARWKTKQLERDYETLKQNYDDLKTNHDSLHEEREKLRTEVRL